MSFLDNLDDPKTMGLLNLAAGLMAAGGPSEKPVSLGAGLLGGLQQYSKTMAEAKKMKMLEEEAAARKMEQAMRLRQMQQAQQKQEALRQAWAQSMRPASPGGEPIGDSGDFTRPSGPSFDQDKFAQLLGQIDPMKAIEMQRAAQKEGRMKLGKGEAVFDPVTGQRLFDNPADEKESMTAVQKAIANRDRYPQGSPMWNLFNNEAQKLTTHAGNKTVVNINEGQKGFENTMSLRKEYSTNPLTKAFGEMRTTYDIVNSSLGMRTPAGDMAAATKFMKLLDPGSVVRESELMMAMEATGMLDKVTSLANRIITGEKLTPSQRQDFSTATREIMSAAASRQQDLANYYRGIAGENQLNADHVAPGSVFEIPKPKSQTAAMPDMPKANGSNKGRTIRNAETGEMYQSDGLRWVKIQ